MDGPTVPGSGDLIVVRREETLDLDWELVHHADDALELESAPYQLDLSGPDGSFSGTALLVRIEGRALVFRGASALEGFDESDFEQGH